VKTSTIMDLEEHHISFSKVSAEPQPQAISVHCILGRKNDLSMLKWDCSHWFQVNDFFLRLIKGAGGKIIGASKKVAIFRQTSANFLQTKLWVLKILIFTLISLKWRF